MNSGVTLIDIPMIGFSSVKISDKIPRTNWIFFSSPACVRFFFEQAALASGKFAAMGPGTARELKPHGEVLFTGISSDTRIVANDFSKVLGNDSVLFPVAADSIRTIQSALPPGQVFEVVCYKKSARPSPIGFPDILLFSSPSNVTAFFEVNTIKSYQQVIAFGPSTASSLSSRGAGNVITLESTEEENIWHAIKSLILG